MTQLYEPEYNLIGNAMETFWQNIKSSGEKRKTLTIIVLIFLVLSLPIFIYGVLVMNFNLFKRAASGEPLPPPTNTPSINYSAVQGSQSYMYTKPILFGKVMTFEGWFKPYKFTDTQTGPQYLFMQGDYGSGNEVSIYISGNNLSEDAKLQTNIHVGGNIHTLTSIKNISFNQWSHIALVLDGSTIYIFLNGSLVASSPYTGNISFTNPQSFNIGSYSTNPEHNVSDRFYGEIDEFRISNVSRYSKTNSNLYALPLILNPDENTIALYHFDGNGLNTGGGGYDLITYSIRYLPRTPSSTPIATASPTPYSTPGLCMICANRFGDINTCNLSRCTMEGQFANCGDKVYCCSNGYWGSNYNKCTIPTTSTPTPVASAYPSSSPSPTATSTPSSLNMIPNGSFERDLDSNKIPDGWTWNKSALSTNEGRVCNTASTGSCSFRFISNATSKILTRTSKFENENNTNHSFILSADVKANRLSLLGSSKVRVQLLDSENNMVKQYNLNIPYGTYEFREINLNISTNVNFSTIKTKIINSKISGSLWVDNVSLSLKSIQ